MLRAMFLKSALLMFGVLCCSMAVILVKLCRVDPILLASYRLIIAAVVLSPLFLRDLRRYRGRYTRRHLLRTVLPGLALGLHFISWMFGARRTTATNATLIVNMLPLVMPFMLYAFLRESPTRREWAGTAITMIGVMILAVGDFRIGAEHLIGDGACAVSLILVACYLTFGRRNRDFPSIWLYVVPLYFVASISSFAIALCFASPPGIDSTADLLYVLALGVGPTVIGHSSINWCLKHMRGQIVSLASMTQFVFAGIVAYFLLDEVPHLPFYPACVFIITGAIVALRVIKPKDTELIPD